MWSPDQHGTPQSSLSVLDTVPDTVSRARLIDECACQETIHFNEAKKPLEKCVISAISMSILLIFNSQSFAGGFEFSGHTH